MTKSEDPYPIIFSRGKRVSLRPPQESDIPLVLHWLNDPDTRRFLSRVHPLTELEEKRFLESTATPGGNHQPFVIVESETHEPIGCTGMHQIDWVHRRAELGIFIGPADKRCQGLGREAFELLIAHAFEGINLHRVNLTVYSFNEVGIRCYERIGFVKEGVDREAQFVEGRYVDVIRYGMLAREWFARKKNERFECSSV
jgi:RimJ/RimL family protein N-acetyltransferase